VEDCPFASLQKHADPESPVRVPGGWPSVVGWPEERSPSESADVKDTPNPRSQTRPAWLAWFPVRVAIKSAPGRKFRLWDHQGCLSIGYRNGSTWERTKVAM